VSNDARLRLGLLLLILVALAFYAVLQRPWEGDDGAEVVIAAPSSSACATDAMPSPKTIDLDRLGRLRSEVSSQAVFGVDLDSYEEGFVGTTAAFSDAEPTMQPIGTSIGGVPAGYEYRWWTPSRHDVVADVWFFDSPARAEDFLARASSPRCRQAATAASAVAPAGGRDLEWRNPFGFMQQDLFFARGSRVYRLAVVAPGAPHKPVPAQRRAGFRLVNALGCELLGLACALRRPSGTVRAPVLRAER
jgi:hypothetical protein